MGFEFGFKMREGISITEVQSSWKLNSTQQQCGHTRGTVQWVKEEDLSASGGQKIWRGKIMTDFKSEEKYFIFDTVSDGESMELL